MRLWKVVVLVDLAVLIGLGGGYLWWGRQAARLERELAQAQAAQMSVEREWTVRGVVRAVLPEANLIVLSHEEMSGYMPAMTMGFRVAAPQIYDGVQIGDAVRFTVRGVPPNMVLTGLERAPTGGGNR
jgi:Cu(I)/Ag(I) efflux system protein CusF